MKWGGWVIFIESFFLFVKYPIHVLPFFSRSFFKKVMFVVENFLVSVFAIFPNIRLIFSSFFSYKKFRVFFFFFEIFVSISLNIGCYRKAYFSNNNFQNTFYRHTLVRCCTYWDCWLPCDRISHQWSLQDIWKYEKGKN